jgi:hypothetical protein
MNECYFPFTSATAFTRKALETLASNPYPDYVKRTYYFKPSGDGYKLYVIYDIEKGNEEEGLLDVMSRACQFGNCIEGMHGTLEPIMTIEQTLAVIGPMMEQEQTAQ